jgi:hypothetical protein
MTFLLLRPLRNAVLVALLVTSAFSASTLSAVARGPRDATSGGAAPATTLRKVATGVFLPSLSPTKLDAFTRKTGHSPGVVMFFQNWGVGWNYFPAKDGANNIIDAIVARGAVPMISWEPFDGVSSKNAAYSLRNIANGAYDSYIQQWAIDAAAWGALSPSNRIYLRFAYEMNGGWFSWGRGHFDNTPTLFKQVWRRVWQIFQTAGATNVRFVFSVNDPCAACWPITKLYPGDKYVNYLGLSSYNWGTSQTWSTWTTMVGTYSSSMTAFGALITTKVSAQPKMPIIVTETGAAQVGGNKALWIQNGYPAVYTKWPRIKAIVYYNRRDPRGSYPADWRLYGSSPYIPEAVLKAYRWVVAQPRFQGTLP